MMKCLTALCVICVCVTIGGLPFVTRSADKGPEAAIEELIEMMKGEPVWGTMNESAVLRAEKSDASAIVVLAPRGSRVEILRDSGMEWYFVRDQNSGKEGWVRGGALDIPPDESAEENSPTPAQLEKYVNTMGYASQTKYLVIVDIRRQQTHVFKGSKHKWALDRSMTVSTGKNASPTVRGEFKLLNRGLWFYSERLGSGGKFWVRFDGAYLFHSVAMDRNGVIIDDTLGRKSSNGCVRLSVPDAEWLYKNVPDKTKIVIL